MPKIEAGKATDERFHLQEKPKRIAASSPAATAPGSEIKAITSSPPSLPGASKIDWSRFEDEPSNNFVSASPAPLARPLNPLAASWEQTEDVSPDEAAAAIRFSQSSGANPGDVLTDPELRRRAMAPPPMDFDKLISEHPEWGVTSLATPLVMSQAKDDLENLSWISRKIKLWSEGLRSGISDRRMSLEGANQLLRGSTPENELRIKEERKKSGERQLQPTGFFENMLYETAKLLPNMAGGAQEGFKYGAAGAMIAGMAGQLGPQAATPEEIVTMPTGFLVGGTTGLALDAYRVESGAMWNDMKDLIDDQGRPIDPAIRAAASQAVGLVNSGIEVGQWITLAKTVPGASAAIKVILKKAEKEAVKRLLKTGSVSSLTLAGRAALGYAGTIGAETGQEILQENVNVLFRAIARGASDVLDDTSFWGSTPAENLMQAKALAKEFYQATTEMARVGMYTFPLLTAPGHAAQLMMDLNTRAETGKAAAQGLLKQMESDLQASKLAQRNPETFEALMHQFGAKQGVPETLYAPAREVVTLMQNSKDYASQAAKAELLGEFGVTESDLIQSANLDLSVPISTAKVQLHAARKDELWQGMGNSFSFSPIQEATDADWRAWEAEAEGSRIPEPSEELGRIRKEFIDAGAKPEVADAIMSIMRARSKAWADSFEGDKPDPSEWLKHRRLQIVPGDEANAAAAVGLAQVTLDQPGEKRGKVRGKINISREEFILNGVISLFKGQNKSTPLHELAHWFRFDLESTAHMPNVKGQVKADWEAASRFVGAKTDFTWTKEQEETWARAIEAYVMTGKAPTPDLQGLFTRLRQWMVAIYRSLRKLNVELNDDIRAVFDRLLATDEEITVARAMVDDSPLFTADELDPADWAEYSAARQKAHTALEEKLGETRMKELKHWQAQWKKEGQAIADEHPGHVAMDNIVKRGKLNLDALRADYDADTVTQLNRQRFGGLAAKDGKLFLDELAEEWGHDSGDELINALLETPSKKQIVSDYMVTQQAEWDSQWSPYDEALSQDQLAVLELEDKYLGKILGMKNPTSTPGIKRIIDQITGVEKPAEKMIPQSEAQRFGYMQAQRAAAKAKREGRIEEALLWKQKQRAHAQKLRDTQRASKAMNQFKATAKRLLSQKSTPLDKSAGIGWDYVQQIRLLLRNVGWELSSRFPVDKRTPVLHEFLLGTSNLYNPDTGQKIGGDNHTIEKWIVGAQNLNYRDFNDRQLNDLTDALKQLATMGRNEKKLIAGRIQEDIDTVIEKMVLAASKLPAKAQKEFEKLLLPDGPLTKVLNGLSWANHQLIKNETLLRVLDGLPEGTPGPFVKYLFQGIVDAENEEARIAARIDKQMNAAFALIPKDEWAGLNDKLRVPGGPDMFLTLEKVLMIACYAGQEDGWKQLQRGYGYKPEQIQAVLDFLKPHQWQFVKSVWRIVNSLFPLLDEKHYLMHGTHLPKIEGIPVLTPSGEIQGDYFPLIYDPKISRTTERYAEHDFNMKDLWRGTYTRPDLVAGAEHKRIGGGDQAPLLDLGVIPRHLFEVIHKATHGPALRDYQKIVNNARFRSIVESRVGEAAYKQIMPYIQDMARPRREPRNYMEKAFSYFRKTATIVIMGLKATTALSQVLGYTQSLHVLGARDTAAGVAEFIAHPIESARFINQKSIFMANRRKSFERDIRTRFEKLKPGMKGKWEPVQNAFFWHIGVMDASVTYPTWLGAYRQSLDKFSMNETEAVAYADSVVRRSQGSGMVKDLSAIQRGGEIQKSMTMFYSYFNTLYNLLYEVGWKYRLGKISKTEAFGAFMLLAVIPAYLGQAMNDRDLPDEKEGAAALLGYLANGIPLVRDFANPVIPALLTNKYYDYRPSPLVEVPKSFIRLVTLPAQKEVTGQEVFERSAESAGYAFGLPSKQAIIIVNGALRIIEGDTEGPLDAVGGLMFRQEKEKQR